MAETYTRYGNFLICSANLARPYIPRMVPVVAGLILYAGDSFESPVVEDLHNIPSSAHVLLVKTPRKKEYEFPGGKKEPDETLEEACRREIREEVGFDKIRDLISLGRKVGWAQDDRNKLVGVAVFHAVGLEGTPGAYSEISDVWLEPIHRKSQRPIADITGAYLNELRQRVA